MQKREIDRKFDEIVSFSGVERFLDTPLKHYSTGMQMRLAFSVAAHLDPEILLVDEVLAVGDAEFQKKCLGKMQDVSKSGRTIVFVSHQMNQVRRLCQRVLWIDEGQLYVHGPTTVVVSKYESSTRTARHARPSHINYIEQASGPIAFRRWIIDNSQSNELNLDEISEKTVLRFRAQVKQEIRKGILFIALRSKDNTILWSNMYHELQLSPGLIDLVHSFERLPLNPGVYV